MTRLSNAYKKSIAVLIQASNSLPWYAKWLFPAKLEIALAAYQNTTDEAKSAWNIGSIFLNHTWFFQRWSLSCLRTFSQSPLINSCRRSLLVGETEENHPVFNASIDPEEAAAQRRIVDGLIDDAIITRDFPDPEGRAYYYAAAEYPNASDIRMGVRELYFAGLLVGEAGKANFDTILVGPKFTPSPKARCLIALNHAGLLSGDNAQTNREILKSRSSLGGKYLGDVVNALRELKDAGLLSGETPESKAMAQANFNAVIQHQKAPWAVARSLVKLSRTGLLTQEEGQEIRDIVSAHKDPEAVTNAILCLHENDSTTEQSSFMIYAQRKVPTFFQRALGRVDRLPDQEESKYSSASPQ